MKTVEFRVIPVTRYIVTRHFESEDGASNGSVGEFESKGQAESAVVAFGDHETMRPDGPDVVITNHLDAPEDYLVRMRTWTRGEGWDDMPWTVETKMSIYTEVLDDEGATVEVSGDPTK